MSQDLVAVVLRNLTKGFKMKIGIYGGEGFPIYEIYSNGFSEIEVDDDTFKRWQKVFDQFSSVQEEIKQELKKQGKGDKVWDSDWCGIHLPRPEE